MKSGKTLSELAGEVERRASARRDFKVSTEKLTLSSNGSSTLALPELGETFGVNEIAHGQIAERLSIPKRYYDRLRAEHPALLDENVNGLFQAEPTRRLVRTLDGDARAFLSDRYRPLDNAELLEAVLPVFGEAESIEVASAEVTDRRLYVKVHFPHLTKSDPNDSTPLHAGVVVSNSEVGQGSLSVVPMVYKVICTNGMISAEYGQRRVHLGRASEEEHAFEIYRDETLEADDRALWLKVQDSVRAALNDEIFTKLVSKIEVAAGQKIEGDPTVAIEEVTKKLDLTEGESGSVLRHLIEGGDLSKWGVVNAVTAASQGVEDYDRATELEVAGGKILELGDAAWREVANAN